MAEHANVALVRRGFEAFNRGDIGTLTELITADARQLMPGRGPLAGEHKGRDNILAMYGQIAELTGGTFRADLRDVYANDFDAVAVYRATAERGGRRLDSTHALVFEIIGGKVMTLNDCAIDQDADDEFWASGNGAKGVALFEAWERRDFDAVVKDMNDDVSYRDEPRGQTLRGKREIKDWFASWATASPDSTVGARVVGESGAAVVIEGVWRGTNSGPLGSLPATDRTVPLPFINVLRLDSAGRISSGSAYYDQLSLMIQLGHMEPPEQAS
jgi:steroid delta-isomerase-like uncharacterized protein